MLKIFKNRNYRKKYNSLKLVYEDLVAEHEILKRQYLILENEVKKLTREKTRKHINDIAAEFDEQPKKKVDKHVNKR